MEITALGTRGSIPVSGSEFDKYGGHTACYLIEDEGDALVIDAGSGIMNLPERINERERLSLLLSHAHLDHILGLPMMPFALRKGKHLDIYAENHSGRSGYEQVHSLMRPPLWPIGTNALPSDIVYYELLPQIELNGFKITTIRGNHPGGVSVFIIERNGKKVVYATDCTLTKDCADMLFPYIIGCDLLLCDGQYTDEEWVRASNFGHNSWRTSVDYANRCKVGCLRIIHHDPTHNDALLDTIDEQVRTANDKYGLAKEGETVHV